MHGSVLSLIPFLVVIPIALLTKQVILGLALGLFTGAYMMHPQPVAGLSSALTYLGNEMAVPGNVSLMLFLYLFGSFVGLLRVSGGVQGFANWMEQRIRSPRGAFAFTWLSSLFTFMAPDFRIMTIAPIVSRAFQRFGVRPERVAFAIDVTSTPLCALVPLGTAFVAYMVGLMHTSSDHAAATASPYRLFLLSIPFNLFAWAMLAVGFGLTFFRHSRTKMHTNRPPTDAVRNASPWAGAAVSRRAAFAVETGAIGMPADAAVQRPLRRTKAHAPEESVPDPVEVLAERARPSQLNLILPLALLLGATVVFTYLSGRAPGVSVLTAFAKANAARAMLEALVITVVAMFVLYTVRRLPLQRLMIGFLQGGNEMMPVIVLLVLIWAVSAVAADLGFSAFCQREIVRYVPAHLIVPALFLFGCAISYVLGSSFGTWGMLMPLAFSLVAGGAESLPLVAGAVFASGTFGGFASPLSDNTIAMATVMKLPVMQYANYKLKSAAVTAVVCAFGYWVVAACLPVGH
ncbi:sodium:proton antiporter [Alicyclobacillus tengchongensis]|nr:sodium:proton antiporter [Alicyclobacillus tengchongensis]